ncbi:ethanolamine utilization protein EutJ [filamentous cyanobacterium CCT1]|nr:ethanolamine utilization protein EutJ [filamentous cyanobacterium CCT1]
MPASRRKFLYFSTGLALSLFGLNSCQSSNSTSSDLTVRIGVIGSLTGDDADSGKALVDGANLAADLVNDEGGLQVGNDKLSVELVVGDTQSTPEGAVEAAQTLINQEAVIAIVGPQYSRYAIPVARLAEQSGMPMISPRSTNPETTAGKQYVFRATFTDEFQGDVIARFARESLNSKRAAVLYDVASPYNRGLAERFQQVYTEAGGTMAAFESYTTGTTDFQAQLGRILASAPDVVFLPNYENEIPNQARQLRQAGIQATLLGADSWGSMEQQDRIPELQGAYFSDQFVPNKDSDRTQGFITRFQQTYGYMPPAGAAATYDSLGILFQAIENQNSTAADNIRDGIANLGEYNGVTGTLLYQGSGDPKVSVAILKIESGRVSLHKEITP